MASKPYTAFLPEVLPRSAGTPDIVALNAIRNAAIEFCSRSLVWTESLDPQTVSSADFPFGLEAPTGARVDTILSLKMGGRDIDPKSTSELDVAYPNWEALTGQTVAYFQPTPDTAQVVPTLDVPTELRLRVAYTPTRASVGIEGFIYENYLEAIAAGALLRLSGDPVYQPVFEAGIRKAAVDAQKSMTTASLQVNLRGAR